MATKKKQEIMTADDMPRAEITYPCQSEAQRKFLASVNSVIRDCVESGRNPFENIGDYESMVSSMHDKCGRKYLRDRNDIDHAIQIYIRFADAFGYLPLKGDARVFLGYNEGYHDKPEYVTHFAKCFDAIEPAQKTRLIHRTAQNNAIGSIYLLKSLYGLYDTPQTNVTVVATENNTDLDSLLEKYGHDK